MEEPQNKFESPEHELEALKKRMAELEVTPEDKNKPELIMQAVQEHVERAPENVVDDHKFTDEAVKTQAGKVTDIKTGKEEGVVETAHQEQVEELLAIASQKGIYNASMVVKEMKDPHLEDDFHDTLVKYFQEQNK